MAYIKWTLVILLASVLTACGSQKNVQHRWSEGNDTQKPQHQTTKPSTQPSKESTQTKSPAYPTLFSEDFPGNIPDHSTIYSLVIDWSSMGKASSFKDQKANQVTLTGQNVKTNQNLPPQQGTLNGQNLMFNGLQSVSNTHLQSYNLPGIQRMVLYTNPKLKANHQVFLAVADGMGGIFAVKDAHGKVYQTHSEDRDSYWTLKENEWYTLMLQGNQSVTYFKFKLVEKSDSSSFP